MDESSQPDQAAAENDGQTDTRRDERDRRKGFWVDGLCAAAPSVGLQTYQIHIILHYLFWPWPCHQQAAAALRGVLTVIFVSVGLIWLSIPLSLVSLSVFQIPSAPDSRHPANPFFIFYFYF